MTTRTTIARSDTGKVRRPQEERSADTRQRLIAAAIEMIAQVGYAAATTSMIADRASVSRGAIQYHFASKADLTVAIMEAIGAELNFRFDVARLAAQPLEARLAAMIEHYWTVFRGPMFRAGLSIWIAIAGDAALMARVEACLRSLREDVAAVWQSLFSDARCSEGERAAVLHIIMATMRGSAIAFMAGRSSANFSAEREQLRRMALAALQGPASGEG